MPSGNELWTVGPLSQAAYFIPFEIVTIFMSVEIQRYKDLKSSESHTSCCSPVPSFTCATQHSTIEEVYFYDGENPYTLAEWR